MWTFPVSDTKSKSQYPQTCEKAFSCALRCLFNNTFKHCDNSHLICVFECHVSACKLQNFLPWKKVKTSTDVLQTGCNYLKTSEQLKSRLLNLTGTLKRSHSEVLMSCSFCALSITVIFQYGQTRYSDGDSWMKWRRAVPQIRGWSKSHLCWNLKYELKLFSF